jgi:starch-binding outer membrane protein, SusD/RagB family
VNYNTISTTATTPFDKLNDESLYYSVLIDYDVNLSISTTAYIDTLLYQSYAANDLRKAIYFRTISGTNIGIKRMYSGTINAFSGLAMDEVFLNRAECLARAGNTSAAMADLNTLLVNRWKTGTYINMTATSASDALQKILVERRKELLFRGLRWTDLKRLNKESTSYTLTRLLNGNTYSLSPGSPLYVFPIPDNEISNSGIMQNPR